MEPHRPDLPARVRLEGARIWTACPAHPWAASIDVRDGRIAAVDGALDPAVPCVRLPPGTVIVPGLIDGHLHLTLGA